MTIIATGEKSYNCQEDSDNNPVADNYIIFHNYIDYCQEAVINIITIPKIPTLCVCGCNEVVWSGGIYKRGHHQKGRIPWNKGLHGAQIAWNKGIKGIHLSPNTEFKKGMIPWCKGIKTGKPAWNRGIPHTEEELKKMSDCKKGKPIKHFVENSFEIRRMISASQKDRKFSDETRKKMSLNHADNRGEKSPGWKGGKKMVWARQMNRKRERGFTPIIMTNPYTEPIDYHHIHPDLPYVVPCPTRIHKMFAGSEGKKHFHNVNAMLGFRFEDVILL